jgi:monothiol glutaredoxin
MNLEPVLHQRIDSMVKSNKVFLFMKGNKTMPQCGFSAKVVGILADLAVDFSTFNVLEDPEIRQGIKAYGNWPTIPQLYIDGEFQGGCDIILELHAQGQLAPLVGAETREAIIPNIVISDAALVVLKDAAKEEDDSYLRVSVDFNFRHNLHFDQKKPQDVELERDGLHIVLDPSSSHRAEGLKLDYIDGPEGAGFKIDNPNAPAQVKDMSVKTLQEKLTSAEESVELFDVRGEDERAIASLEKCRPLDAEGQAHIEALPKDRALVFMCHHGGRSRQAAEHYMNLGFKNIYSVTGGIDAWSQVIDSSVPRY